MNPINENQTNYDLCCFPKKKKVLLKKNYANLVKLDKMDGIDPKREKDIYDLYISKIDSQTHGL